MPDSEETHIVEESEHPTDAQLIAAFKHQTQSIRNLTTEVVKLRRSLRRSWRVVTVDVLVTVVSLVALGFSIHSQNTANNAQIQSQAAIAANKAACKSSNDVRASDKDTWFFILGLVHNPSNSPTVTAQLAQAKAFVEKRDAPRNCNKLQTVAFKTTTTQGGSK